MIQSSQSHEICLNEGSVNLLMNNPLQTKSKVNSSNITHVCTFQQKICDMVIWLRLSSATITKSLKVGVFFFFLDCYNKLTRGVQCLVIFVVYKIKNQEV